MSVAVRLKDLKQQESVHISSMHVNSYFGSCLIYLYSGSFLGHFHDIMSVTLNDFYGFVCSP